MITEFLTFLVDRIPDDLFSLGICRENVRISSFLPHCLLNADVEIDFVFSCSPMPSSHGPFPSIPHEPDYILLVFTIIYIVRK